MTDKKNEKEEIEAIEAEFEELFETSPQSIITTKTINHPAEKFLGIEPGTTVVEYEEKPPTVLVKLDEYDDKDTEIEDQFQVVYDKAMEAFDDQSAEAEMVEGKYKARNAEVAVQYLNAALNAVKEKSDLKRHKDKLTVDMKKADTPNNQTNNLIVDRNDLIRLIREKDK